MPAALDHELLSPEFLDAVRAAFDAALDDAAIARRIDRELAQHLAQQATPRLLFEADASRVRHVAQELADRLGPWLDELYSPVLPPALKREVKQLFSRGLMPADVARHLAAILESALGDRLDELRGRHAGRNSQTPTTGRWQAHLARAKAERARKIAALQEEAAEYGPRILALRRDGVAVQKIARLLGVRKLVVDRVLLHERRDFPGNGEE